LLLTGANQRKKRQHREQQELFHLNSGFGPVMLDEQNGALLDVKRNLALRSLWHRQTCRPNNNYFRATPKALDVGKHSQQRQTNNNDQHQENSDVRGWTLLRFFGPLFW
jgi:hypothetical protein